MSAADEARKRRGIEGAARDVVRSSGGRLSYEQAKKRVTEAVQRGDAKRANNNR